MRPATAPVMMAQVIIAKAIWNPMSMMAGYVSPSGTLPACAIISPVAARHPSWSKPPKNGIDPSPPYANDHPQITHITPTTPMTAMTIIIVFTTFLRRESPP